MILDRRLSCTRVVSGTGGGGGGGGSGSNYHYHYHSVYPVHQ
jgi:hypothetical protein